MKNGFIKNVQFCAASSWNLKILETVFQYSVVKVRRGMGRRHCFGFVYIVLIQLIYLFV